MFSPKEADINETKTEPTETEEPAVPTTNISDEHKLKQLKDDLLCNLRAELKNMLAVKKRNTDVNNEVSYKKHTEVLQEPLHYLKSEIIKKNYL